MTTQQQHRARPNIVMILTDDQRTGTLETMPFVRRHIMAPGRRYHGVASTAICCPVRTSLLSGNFSHTTGVYTNSADRGGGWPRFHRHGQELRTLPHALHRVGYRTGLFGKYLNGWGLSPEGFVPPGWDVFRALWFADPDVSGAYYGYWIKGTGRPRWYGAAQRDYSTDVTARLAVRFIRHAPDGQPLFVLWTPYAPHLPATPAPRDVGSWQAPSPYRNPAVNERRMGDKQRTFQRLPYMSTSSLGWMRDQTMESLRAVDRGVARIFTALGPERRRNTLFLFASDQGYLWGEHRMATKYVPYRWATDYPLMVRWDGRVTPGVSSELVPIVDVTAALLQAGRASIGRGIEGRSFFTHSRKRVVLEGTMAPIENTYPRVHHPAYCGVRTQRYMYVLWSGDRRAELYDYRVDPFELHNRVDHAGYRAVRNRLHQYTERLCRPKPPLFCW